MRRLALGLVALLVVAAPAGADIVDRKQSVDSRITALQDPGGRGAREGSGAPAGDRRRLRPDPRLGAAGRRRLLAPRTARARAGAARGQAQPAERAPPGAERPVGIPARGVPASRSAGSTTASSQRTKRTRPTSSPSCSRRSSFSAFLDGLDYIKLVATRDRQIADAVRSSRDEVAVALAHTKAARPGHAAPGEDLRRPRSPGARPARPAAWRARAPSSTPQSRKKADLASLSAQERADAERDRLPAGR